MHHPHEDGGQLASTTRRGCLAVALVAVAMLGTSRVEAAPNEASWRERYGHARSALIDGRSNEAAVEFEALASDAPTEDDAALARELASVARASARRSAGPEAPHIRSSDELAVLYASAFVYGLGTSGWVVLLTQPSNFAAAIAPFVGITGAAVGAVALTDGYKPFRRGVPHSIAAGLYLGLGEGAWIVGFQHGGATRRDDDSRWGAPAVATTLWAGATAGGVIGGFIGAVREPTPGRVSFTSSAGTWTGLASGFLGAALESRDRSRTETAFLVGGIGYNVGILTGIAVAPLVAPSVTRVRFVDLGAIAGGLVGGGTYAITANSSADVPAGLGCAAAGMVAGIGLAWWLTDGMPHDPPTQEPNRMSVRPLLTPTRGGLMVGVNGEL